MEERKAPVREGEEYEVGIESVGEKGDGIARVKGFVLFVAGVKKGDYVKIKITKVLQKVGFAQMVKKLEKPVQAVRSRRFVTVRQDEMEEMAEPDEKYEDTDDFGEDLVEEE